MSVLISSGFWVVASMDCSSSPPPPPPPVVSGGAICSEMAKDHILNMSPRPSHHLNPVSMNGYSSHLSGSTLSHVCSRKPTCCIQLV